MNEKKRQHEDSRDGDSERAKRHKEAALGAAAIEYYFPTPKEESPEYYLTGPYTASLQRAESKRHKPGDTWFSVVWNDEKAPRVDHLVDLVALKVIYSLQLPNMPKEYVCRLVLDTRHRSLCLKKMYDDGTQRVIGGITIRLFSGQRFSEIAFCAVSSTEQVRGYGSILMNNLKEYAKELNIEYFLTFADNFAIGYFKKQGFTKNLTLPSEEWTGFLKEYDGGTLMECRIYKSIDYMSVKSVLQQQRAAIAEKIQQLTNQLPVFAGLDFKEGKLEEALIPGVLESSRWRRSRRQSTRVGRPSASATLQGHLYNIFKTLHNMKEAWPFHAPVDPDEVPLYYEYVENPIDMIIIEEKLDKGEYLTADMFAADMQLMLNNCREFNLPKSCYIRCANALDKKFQQLFHEMKRDLGL